MRKWLALFLIVPIFNCLATELEAIRPAAVPVPGDGSAVAAVIVMNNGFTSWEDFEVRVETINKDQQISIIRTKADAGRMAAQPLLIRLKLPTLNPKLNFSFRNPRLELTGDQVLRAAYPVLYDWAMSTD